MSQKKRIALKDEWDPVRVYVVDEVSMLSSKLLYQLCATMKIGKGSMHAFGGVHVILVGDFYQHPPAVHYIDPVCVWTKAPLPHERNGRRTIW